MHDVNQLSIFFVMPRIGGWSPMPGGVTQTLSHVHPKKCLKGSGPPVEMCFRLFFQVSPILSRGAGNLK